MDAVARAGDSGGLSPLDTTIESMLPGLAQEVLPVPLSDEEIEELPAHTAARLLELHPDRYALATALFFGCPTMSGREICRIARVGSHTLQCIIEREERGRTAEAWRKGASARLRSIADMAMSASQSLLADSEAIKGAGIKGLATLLRESTHAHELLAGRAPGQSAEKRAGGSEADTYLASLRDAAHAQSIEGEEKAEAGAELAGEEAGADRAGMRGAE